MYESGALKVKSLMVPIGHVEYSQKHITISFQCLWTFNAPGCPSLATEHFLLQPLVCGTIFHHMSLLPLSLHLLLSS